MTTTKNPRFRKSLARSFQWFFLGAVLIPLLAFCRIAYDSYVQKIALKQRELRDHHRILGFSLDKHYRLYRKTLKEIGRGFSKDKALQRLSGAKDPNLWFGRSKHFLSELESNPLQKRKILLSYLKQNRRYKKTIWSALYEDITEYDEWKAPLKAQVSVWERSHSSLPSHQGKDVFQKDLLMGGAKHLSSPFFWALKYGNLVDRLPMHQIFYTGNSLMNQIWHNLEKTARELLLSQLFGKNSVPTGDLANIEKVSKASLADSRSIFIPFQLPGFTLGLFWETLPANFDREEYKAGRIPAPEGIYFLILDHSKAESHFLELVSGKHRTKALRFISQGLDQWKSDLQDEAIALAVVNLRRLDKKGASPASFVTLGFDPKLGMQTPDASDAGEVLQSPWTIDGRVPFVETLIGILDEKTGKTNLEGESLTGFFENLTSTEKEGREWLFASSTTVSKYPDLKKALKASKTLNRALSFTYAHPSSEEMIGTVMPSSVFPGRAYVFLQSQEKFRRQILSQQILYLGLFLFVVVGVGILGRLLSRQVVLPVVELSGHISELEKGQFPEGQESERDDEIGDLSREFQRMARRIQEKLFEMRSIGTVNLLMTYEFSRSLMLRYILHLLCIRYSASFGVIGFFENRLSEIHTDYQTWNPLPHSDEKQRQIIEALVRTMKENEELISHHDKEDLQSIGLNSNSAITCRLLPAQGEQAKIQGLLFMAGMEEDSRMLFSDGEQNPVIHLSGQAKLAVLKSLLDEIQSDARKGKEVQEGLMPSTDPTVGGRIEVGHYFHGARGLAGDFFDYIQFEQENLIGFAIADVSGKGVGPSLFGATAKAYLKVLALKYPDSPGTVLAELNGLLCTNTSSLFLTLFYVVLDLQSLEIKYASAGHNDMFYLSQTSDLKLLKAKGLPLGMLDDQIYETCTLTVCTQESLVLYTDGIPELENPGRELFGRQRFEQFCLGHLESDSATWAKELETELDEFRRGVHPSDDVTALRIRILSSFQSNDGKLDEI
jgi:serine phosphatase RsbU (regulator of sigma subunit)